MASGPARGAEVEAFVPGQVAAHPADIAKVTAEHFGISTSVPVALARVGDENLVSRSQAKRLLIRLDRFEDVILDFRGVESIGQAFADEIFRVFAGEHPGVKLVAAGTTPAVDRMIRRALAHAAEDRKSPTPTG